VHLARHKKSQALFALKKIPKAVIKSHMMMDQLALEIRIQSCLSHSNVLGMYGFFEDKTHLYIVLEYMDGGTLYEKLKRGKLSEREAAFVIRNITQAVEYLHDLGIAHRDIKP
jgi:serine/threonine protein kinase